MNLEPTPDQSAIREAFQHVFTRESGSERVRAAAGTGFDAALWSLLCELGAPGIAVPDSAGGAGAGLLELVLVAAEAGRRLVCAPLVEAAVAARVLAGERSEVAADMLRRALAGETLVVFAPRRASTTARLVPGGAVADAVVAYDGDELVIVEQSAASSVPDLGFVAAADRPLAGDTVRRTVLSTGSAAARRWNTAHAEWRLGTAGLLAGIGAEALAIAVAYALERRQFGVPIGTFQALQQQLATVATSVEGTELLAWESAWRADERQPGWERAAAMAFAHSAQAAVSACETGLHVHGGYGYTLEYDIQLYLRRAKGLQLADGDPELVWEEVGAATAAAA
jgi:alkylation response protein AidB-like acyl-CoA dehydrogenase